MHRLLKRVLISRVFQLITCFTFIYLIVDISETPRPTLENRVLVQAQKCEVIHLGIVITDYTLCTDFYYLLKSLLYQRQSSLHFHIVVDDRSENILKTLFQTWLLAQVNVTFYNTKSIDTQQLSNEVLTYILPKLVLLNSEADKLIVLGNNKILYNNVYKLWTLFENFHHDQAVGIIRVEDITSDPEHGNPIFLFKLNELQELSYQEIIDVANSKMVYEGKCPWIVTDEPRNCYDSEENLIMAWQDTDNAFPSDFFESYDGSLLKPSEAVCLADERPIVTATLPPNFEVCMDYFATVNHSWRTLSYITKFEYKADDYDVTFVSQLSYSRINLLEELANAWEGPMSLAVLLPEKELPQLLKFIDNSAVLSNRSNIGCHAVFQEPLGYPINVLRNVALNNSESPYVFLIDADFIPSPNAYNYIKSFLAKADTTAKKAFIVPAFETDFTTMPSTKTEVMDMLKNNTMKSFHLKQYARAHSPTNFLKWQTATTPYEVAWKPEFEPYVVVTKNVPRYDSRFFGYGWNKVSQILDLAVQSYSFIVLPEVYIVHKTHPVTKDKRHFLRSTTFRKCLMYVRRSFLAERKVRISGNKLVRLKYLKGV